MIGYGFAAILVMLDGPVNVQATGTEAPVIAVPGFNERLNRALGSEGGVQVYQDSDGNVGTLIDPPGGERRFTVQPPPSPSMNLGPPLQLHQAPVPLPPFSVPPPLPCPPPAAQFPQKAR